MCQCQLSSPEFASGAAMPPCAATVCERVGKTLLSTATLRLARASSSAARIPAPPAPTTIASNLRTERVNSSPKDLHGPAQVTRKEDQCGNFQGQAQARGLDVIHEHVADAHPGMPDEARGKKQRGDTHPAGLEQAPPRAVVHREIGIEHRE